MTLFVVLATLVIFGVYGGEGVGAGRAVYVTQGSDIVAATVTNSLSEASVGVESGVYEVEIVIPRTNPFFIWQCFRTVTVDDPTEYLVIDCVRKWQLQLPFLGKSL